MRYDGETTKLDVQITFSCGNGPEGEYRHIRVIDDMSGLVILDLDISHESFGRALAMSTGKKNASVRLFPNNNFGKTLEVKQEMVSVDFDIANSKEDNVRLAEAAKVFEVDGWKFDGKVNRRRWNHCLKEYNATFRRYV